MKASILLALVILVIGVVPGLFQKRQLAQLREDYDRQVIEAVKHGLSVEDSTESRQTKKNRVEVGRQAGAIADEIVAFHMELETLQSGDGTRKQAMLDRELEMKSRLLSMDPGMLRQVVAALEAKTGIPDEAKREIIGFAIRSLLEEHPEGALALYTQAYRILEKSAVGDQVLSSALARWAEISSEAALSWVHAQAGILPAVAGDLAKRAVISGTAVNDPALAFRLIGELQPEDSPAAIRAIVGCIREAPAKSDLVLTSLRQHLSTIRDEKERDLLRGQAFESFARNLSGAGFDASSAWLGKAALSAKVKEEFSAGLSYFSTKDESGQWIDWLSANLAAGSVEGPVSTLVSEWTQKDHQSAGKWLLSAQDGPAKVSAVRAYAIAVAGYEPAVAAQWAMTLPAGPARDTTIRTIHQNWPASDPEGAAAFAREHGLK